MATETRYDRQLPLFGKDGQDKLRNSNVAIIGLGGLGSHIVQQLALLGVGEIIVCDFDFAVETNLNRLVGARHDDPILKTPKVEIARRLVEAIDPSVRVNPIQRDLTSPECFDAIRKADYVFGCVDNDGPRLILTELCGAYGRPYFDLATEIPSKSPMDFGGRVCFSHNGECCLYCMGLLAATEVRQYFASPEQRLDAKGLYGVLEADLGTTGPSVVTLNGVVASLAATEFMLHVTGLRKAKNLLYYHGWRGIVTASLDQPGPDCFYCKSVFGSGSKADVERYLGQHQLLMDPPQSIIMKANSSDL